MASIGDLKGRVVIDNAGSAVLNKLKADIDGVAAASKKISFAHLGQIPSNAIASLRHQIDRLNKSTAAHATLAGGAGLAFKGMVDQTRGFNEDKFSYGVARMSDHIKDGKLDLAGWRKDIDDTANAVRVKAKAFGAIPDVVMKARAEVEKLGFRGAESLSIWEGAIGLHLAEPKNLDSGKASQFLGAVYRAYENDRKKLAAKLGKDANDPEFQRQYIQGLAGKALVAGADSALGPANIVEGLRQYAPQWASMGISYDYALAMLAHGSNYGFQAPELGTHFKSMANRIVKPTNAGLAAMQRLGLNRADYFGNAQAAAPDKATNQLGALLPGLFAGKGGGGVKSEVRTMLDNARRTGTTTSSEFQNELTAHVMKRLGPGWEGRIGDVRRAVSNATITSDGTVDLERFNRDLIKSGATPADRMEIREGRHYARGTPEAIYHDKLDAIIEKLSAVDGGATMNAVVEARRNSETGKTDQMLGSWQNLMIALEQSGGLVDRVKDAIIGLNTALAGLPTEALTGIAAGAIALGSIGALAIAAKTLPVLGRVGRLGLTATGAPAAVGGAAALIAYLLMRGGALPGSPVVGAPIGLGTATTGGGAIMGVQAAKEFTLRTGLKATFIGAGRLLVPGIGILSLGAMGWGAYTGYRDTGTVGGAVRGALGIGESKAETPSASTVPIVPNPLSNFDQNGQYAPAVTQNALEQMVQMVQAVDLTAEGRRIGASLAAGLRDSLPEVMSAMSSLTSAANKVELNVGPSMQGSK